MKKTTSVSCCAVIACALILSACSSGPRVKHISSADRAKYLHSHHLDKLPASDVPLEVNERVIAWMDFFSGPGSGHFRRYLERSGRYIPMMQGILKKYGLPKDLVYVALIESGFSNNARSFASAVGPWQFIKGTGKRYGLRIDSWVDERRDPVKSTHAAAKYLRDLYNEFHDWYLAMAAYNAGEGRVRRAIDDSGSRNFWTHADPDANHLRAETRDYVPKYIAANIMAKMPADFGFGNVNYQKPIDYDTATIPSQTDLDVIAKCAGTSSSEIEDLNPELRMGATPPETSRYEINLPKGNKEKFLVAYAKVPTEERIKIVTHEVQKGEKLGAIAKRYGVSSKALASANGLSRKSKLAQGQRLVIPVGAGYKARVASLGDDDESSSSSRRSSGTYYKVRKGDTIGSIASRHGVTVTQIKSWNGLGKKSHLRAGQKIKVGAGERASARVAAADKKTSGAQAAHKVKPGETLWAISSKYGVSVDELSRMNDLRGKKIHAGQTLIIRGGSGGQKQTEENSDIAAAGSGRASKAQTTKTGYTVKRGDTASSIAKRNGVSVKDLAAWNGLNPRKPSVRIGQKLVINKSAPAVAEKKKPTTTSPEKTETTMASSGVVGDKSLATDADISNASTAIDSGAKSSETPATSSGGTQTPAASTQEPQVLKPMSSLTPPTQSTPTSPADQAPKPSANTTTSAKPAHETSQKSSTATTYKIKSGDTLWSIAKSNGVSVDEIKSWNKLDPSSKIKPGQSIVIKK